MTKGTPQLARIEAAKAVKVLEETQRITVSTQLEAIRLLNEADSAAALATAVDTLATYLDTAVRT
jgi:hypothetical protein